MQSIKQLVLIGLLAALIGTVVVLRYFSGNETGGDTTLEGKEALARYGFYLREVSGEAGIHFTHQAPTLDSSLDHIMPIIASMGAAVSVVDFDKDGWPDIYVINSGEGSRSSLFRNQHDGTFKDVAGELGIADLNVSDTGVCMGAVWGDYDNDGYDDLFIDKWGRPELFHNDKGKGFTRVTAKAGLPGWVNANSAIWLDYDCDGKLDLFLAGYWDEKINLWRLDSTKIMPESFEYAENGGRKYLLRGKGDGTFEDVTEDVGIKSRRWTLAVAAGNLRGTSYPDIVLANDYGYSEFLANHEGKHFAEIGKKSGIAERPKSGMNVSFGDIFNQGRPAIYISNITEAGVLPQGNNLWVPQKGGSPDSPRYTNLAHTLGVELGGWSWGTQFGDLNNDGLLDLYLTNGYITTDTAQTYWHDYGHIAMANKLVISDAKNWPAMHGRSLGGNQQKCLWINRGGKFIDVAQAVGACDTFDGRSVVLVDLWNRGVLDVVVANQKGPLLVYKNTVAPDRHWLQLELEGTKSNKSAIGAEVRVYWAGKQQVQEVSGGSGYSSQNPHRLHFGLGEHAQVEKVVIRWPCGVTQTLDAPKVDTRIPVKEPR
jgi:hypothetical protein